MLPDELRSRYQSQNRRLAKLTANPVESEEVDIRRFCRIVAAIQDTPGVTEEAAEVVFQWLVERWHWQTPNRERDGDGLSSDRGKGLEERNRLAVAAFLLLNQLPADLRAIVARTAFPDEREGMPLPASDGGDRWAADWCQSAASLNCRFSEEVRPEVMEAMVSIFQDQADKIDGFEVCCSCGFRMPRHKKPPLTEWRIVPGTEGEVRPRYNLPRFFKSCPACGSVESVWEGHSHEKRTRRKPCGC